MGYGGSHIRLWYGGGYVRRSNGDLLVRVRPELPSRFILAEIPGLYTYPRPYAYKKPWVALQKYAASVIRLHGIAVAHRYLSTYRQSSEEEVRVFASASFEQGISPGSFLPYHWWFAGPFPFSECTPSYSTC